MLAYVWTFSMYAYILVHMDMYNDPCIYAYILVYIDISCHFCLYAYILLFEQVYIDLSLYFYLYAYILLFVLVYIDISYHFCLYAYVLLFELVIIDITYHYCTSIFIVTKHHLHIELSHIENILKFYLNKDIDDLFIPLILYYKNVSYKNIEDIINNDKGVYNLFIQTLSNLEHFLYNIYSC